MSLFFLGVPSAGQEEGGDRSQASTGGPAVHLPVWIRPVLRALGLPVLGSYYQQTDHSKTWQLKQQRLIISHLLEQR